VSRKCQVGVPGVSVGVSWFISGGVPVGMSGGCVWGYVNCTNCGTTICNYVTICFICYYLFHMLPYVPYVISKKLL
jgi:hypothetical protein